MCMWMDHIGRFILLYSLMPGQGQPHNDDVWNRGAPNVFENCMVTLSTTLSRLIYTEKCGMQVMRDASYG